MMNYDVGVEFELKVWGRNKETKGLEFGSTDMYLPTQWSAMSCTLCFIWHVHVCYTALCTSIHTQQHGECIQLTFYPQNKTKNTKNKKHEKKYTISEPFCSTDQQQKTKNSDDLQITEAHTNWIVT